MKMLTNLAKATLSAVVTPVALATDILSAPACTWDTDRKVWGHTASVLENAKECFKAAVKPEKG